LLENTFKPWEIYVSQGFVECPQLRQLV